jgi:DNA-binding IscR family transcriptional regulator
MLIANGGVPKLAGRVVTRLLSLAHGATKKELVTFFSKKNGLSINENDFSQVFKLLKSIGCITSTRGRNATWTLTPKGAAVFRSAKVNWIGKKQ